MVTNFTQKTKIGVIDVGSNSVRLMMSLCGKTLYKAVTITRLAEGSNKGSFLTQQAMARTKTAICDYVKKAKEEGADKVYVFATQAVRGASNGNAFAKEVESACGVKVDVVGGEVEAELGLLGALNGNDGAIIDIGGASTEISVVKDGVKVYCKSLNIGTVVMRNNCGQVKGALSAFIDSVIVNYGDVPKAHFYGIGGTITSACAVMQSLCPYDPSKTHGYNIKLDELIKLKDRIFGMTLEELLGLVGLQKERAPVFAGGVLLLVKLMQKLGIEQITVSESDNLEGYLKLKENI